jgi:hypothetical protein
MPVTATEISKVIRTFITIENSIGLLTFLLGNSNIEIRVVKGSTPPRCTLPQQKVIPVEPQTIEALPTIPETLTIQQILAKQQQQQHHHSTINEIFFQEGVKKRVHEKKTAEVETRRNQKL